MEDEARYDLKRFLHAQAENYPVALKELKNGKKRSHWIWYVFPQVAGLGTSAMAEAYAIRSREESEDYVKHPVLGARLIECSEVMLTHKGRRVTEIMGSPDDMKLRSSMTLFSIVAPQCSVFDEVLETFFGGTSDQRTLDFLIP